MRSKAFIDKIDDALQEVYDDLIFKSWEHAETFEAYQDAWKTVEKAFKVHGTSGNLIKCGIKEVNDNE